MRALAIAATGMNAQQLNVEVIANNISNVNTTAFKAARAEFTDLLYQTERSQAIPNQRHPGSSNTWCGRAPSFDPYCYRGARVSGIPSSTGCWPSSSSRTPSCGTSCPPIRARRRRTGLRPGARSTSRLRFFPSSRPGVASSRSAGSRTPGSAARTSATRRTGAPRPFAAASRRRCWDRVGRWSASPFAATRSCSRRR